MCVCMYILKESRIYSCDTQIILSWEHLKINRWNCFLNSFIWLKAETPKKNWIVLNSLSKSTEKAMAPHSSTLAWKIPWTEEPGRLQSMGLLRVRHNWATSLSIFTFMHWKRKWQRTPGLLPGESWGSLVGCHLRGHTESDTTEVT